MKIFLIVLIFFSLFLSISAKPSIISEKENIVFCDLQNEEILVKYFMKNNQKRYFRKLDKTNKWKYIEAFWKANDPNPANKQNEFLKQIKVRIEYSNKYFTHFEQGWKTDRGRIYIRYGEPFDIIKNHTGRNTKYSDKEYQIWKYRITSYQTYIFIDLQMHGNYRLIYSEGDPREDSRADWRSYLGTDFDEGILY